MGTYSLIAVEHHDHITIANYLTNDGTVNDDTRTHVLTDAATFDALVRARDVLARATRYHVYEPGTYHDDIDVALWTDLRRDDDDVYVIPCADVDDDLRVPADDVPHPDAPVSDYERRLIQAGYDALVGADKDAIASDVRRAARNG